MKLSTTEQGDILVEEVYNSMILKTNSGEELAICMRDSGFEFKYQGNWYSAQQGQITQWPVQDGGVTNSTDNNTIKPENPHNCFGRKPHIMDFEDRDEYLDRLSKWITWEDANK